MEKNEDVKNTLKRWGTIIEECRNKQREIEKLKALCRDARDISGIKMDGMPKGNKKMSRVENAVIDTICMYEDNIERLNKEIQELIAKKEKMDGIISELGLVEQRIMRMRYIEKKSWDYINVMTGYSRRQCFRIHDEGIGELRKRMGSDKLFKV